MTSERSATNDRTVAEHCNDYLLPTRKRLDAPIGRTDEYTLEAATGNTSFDLFSDTSVANAGYNDEAIDDALEAEAAGGADV